MQGFLQFLSMILIVRNMEIADYGWYVSAISAFEVMVIFCLPGTIRIALRSVLSNNSRFGNLLGLRLILLPLLMFGFLLMPHQLAILFFVATIADQISMFARVKLNQKKKYLMFNILESLKPFLLIVFVILHILTFDELISIEYIAIIYCFVSVLVMILNILFSKKYAYLSLMVLLPEKKDLLDSIYASGNGLIGIFIRRGAVLVAAITFSTTDAAYVNIGLQFLTIFTMLYSGLSLSMTRDIYDRSISFTEIKDIYLNPLFFLTSTIIFSSIVLYFYGDVLLVFFFGIDAVGASEIIYLTPLILLFQLPQLIIMGLFMRLEKEKLILFMNCFSILFFLPILVIFSKNLLTLIIILLIFVFFTSLLYLLTFSKLRF